MCIRDRGKKKEGWERCGRQREGFLSDSIVCELFLLVLGWLRQKTIWLFTLNFVVEICVIAHIPCYVNTYIILNQNMKSGGIACPTALTAQHYSDCLTALRTCECTHLLYASFSNCFRKLLHSGAAGFVNIPNVLSISHNAAFVSLKLDARTSSVTCTTRKTTSFLCLFEKPQLSDILKEVHQ